MSESSNPWAAAGRNLALLGYIITVNRKITIVIGAGASYDCADENSQTNDAFRPPLTKRLFHNRPEFGKILAKYPGAEELSGEIRARTSSEGLEDVLKELSTRKSPFVRSQYHQVALYLQDLIKTCSSQYMQSGSTRYSELLRSFAEHETTGLEYMILSLNYDMYLENAIDRLYGEKFLNVSSYVQPGRSWQYLKLHGSCHWGYRIPFSTVEWPGWQEWLKDNEILLNQQYKPEPIVAGNGLAYYDGRYVWYPALAVPLGSVKHFVCPRNQVQLAEKFLSECHEFLIIGMSAADESIRNLLKSVKSVDKCYIANGDADSCAEAFTRIAGSAVAFKSIRSDPNARIYIKNGFIGLLRDDHLSRFLDDF